MSSIITSKTNCSWRYRHGTYFVDYIDADGKESWVTAFNVHRVSPSILQFETSSKYEQTKTFVKFSWKKYSHDLDGTKEKRFIHPMFDDGNKMPSMDEFICKNHYEIIII